jgi:hypothetical protein
LIPVSGDVQYNLGMRFRNLRITWSSLFGVVVFSLIHFVAGVAVLGTWMILGRQEMSVETVKLLVGILLEIWWFPAHQIYMFLNVRSTFASFAFPIVNSLLWGAVIFAIWRANHADTFKFSIRFLLIAAAFLVALLGIIMTLLIIYGTTNLSN